MAEELNTIFSKLEKICETLRKFGPDRRQKYAEAVRRKIGEAEQYYNNFRSIVELISVSETEYSAIIIDSLIDKIEVVYGKINSYKIVSENIKPGCKIKKIIKMDTFDLRTAANLIAVMDGREETTEKIIDSIELYDSCLTEKPCKKLLVSFVLKTRLSKSARLKLKNEYSDTTDLIKDMRKFLLTKKSANSLLSQLNSVSQNDMTITQYAAKIEELMVDLTISQADNNEAAYEILRPLNEQMAIKKFADGLRNRRLSTIITARNYSELKDAVRAAQDEEIQSQPVPSTSNSMLNMRVMSGAGAELVVLGHNIAPLVLVGAASILILETMWVAALFVDLLCRRGEYTLSLRCWDFFRWSCGRARAPYYACVATALLFADLTLLATAAGGMLLVLAALRAAVPFSPYATHGPHSPRAGSALLSQHDSPLPDVFFNAAHTGEDRSEEMTVLDVKTPGRSRSVTPKPPLLEL